MSLIETELGEIPAVKLHCPPATVQVFLEAIAAYYEKEGKEVKGKPSLGVDLSLCFSLSLSLNLNLNLALG